jgi:hypothetical protein
MWETTSLMLRTCRGSRNAKYFTCFIKKTKISLQRVNVRSRIKVSRILIRYEDTGGEYIQQKILASITAGVDNPQPVL